MTYRVIKVNNLLEPEFEQLLNQMDGDGYRLHSVIPQVSEWETYCNVVIFVKKSDFFYPGPPS